MRKRDNKINVSAHYRPRQQLVMHFNCMLNLLRIPQPAGSCCQLSRKLLSHSDKLLPRAISTYKRKMARSLDSVVFSCIKNAFYSKFRSCLVNLESDQQTDHKTDMLKALCTVCSQSLTTKENTDLEFAWKLRVLSKFDILGVRTTRIKKYIYVEDPFQSTIDH